MKQKQLLILKIISNMGRTDYNPLKPHVCLALGLCAGKNQQAVPPALVENIKYLIQVANIQR